MHWQQLHQFAARQCIGHQRRARGELVELLPQTRLHSPLAYWLMLAPRSAARPEVKAFADWVLAQAVATRQVIGEGDDPDLVNDLD